MKNLAYLFTVLLFIYDSNSSQKSLGDKEFLLFENDAKIIFISAYLIWEEYKIKGVKF